jgi:hypothetical protein
MITFAMVTSSSTIVMLCRDRCVLCERAVLLDSV